MKKILSIILCVAMIFSLFVIGAEASITKQSLLNKTSLYYRDGESTETAYATNQITVANGTSVNVVNDGTGNSVMEFAWNGTGAKDSNRLYALYAIPNAHMTSSWENCPDFTFEFDVKAVNNTTGIGVSMHYVDRVIHIYPAAFSTEKWSKVKIESLGGVINVYIKDRSESNSTYRLLTESEDYFSSEWTISGGTTFLLLDTAAMDAGSKPEKYDIDNFKSAKYLIDRIDVKKIEKTTYSKNMIYEYADEITFDTTLGATGYEHKFSPLPNMPGNTFTWTFDAVKTGGERPVNVTFAPKSGSGNPVYAVNILTAVKDVKYTYKADYVNGKLTNFARKAQGETTFENLTPDKDYAESGPYGAWGYIKFGYLGEYYKNNPTNLKRFCGDNPALDDVNTKWTFNNIQITGTDAGVSAVAHLTDEGHDVVASVVGRSADVSVMAAVYDDDAMVTSGIAKVNHEGEVRIPLTHNVSNPTIKLFVWDGTTAAPLAEEWDISDMVQIPEEDDMMDDDAAVALIPGQNGLDGEFYVDWSKPATYSDWTMTGSEDMSVDKKTGVLTWDIQNTQSTYLLQYRPKATQNYDFEFKMKIEDFGTKDFGVKITNDGYNNYQYFAPDRITMTSREHAQSGGMGLLANTDTEWHDWKFELRGEYCTIYMDGGELYRFKQGLWATEPANIAFMLSSTPNDSYKIHFGKFHYRPYFPKAQITSPANGAVITDGSTMTFKASADSSVTAVDYYVNGVKVGSGTTAPDYAYSMTAPSVGTYRVSAGVGGEIGPESIITVESGLTTYMELSDESISYGSSTTLKFSNAKQADVSKVEVFANGKYIGDASYKNYYITGYYQFTLSGLPVGSNNISARVTSAKTGAYYYPQSVVLEVTSSGNQSLILNREYEIDYTYSGTSAIISAGDGYFGLNIAYNGNTLTYQTNEGQKTYTLGKGTYKLVVTSGLVDLYYNGQFALSWYMPGTTVANTVSHTGLTNFTVGGSGVKKAYHREAWNGSANYTARVNNVPSNYSVEFDKTDASDEIIAFYDGEYEIKLDIKDGVITTRYHDVETGENKPFTLNGTAKAGYWRITVAKGLAQVWIDNIYVDSFSAPAIAHIPSIQRKMSNPSASTIIEVKGTDDRYYHNEDFSGSAELNPMDYWIVDSDSVTASVMDEAMTISGTGDVYLNGQSDDVHLKWSATINSADDFYVAPRVFRGPYYYVHAGYNYGTQKWYIKSYSKDTRYGADSIREWSGTAPSLNKKHTFELIIEDESLILKMDNKSVIDAGVYMPFWGYTGFGIQNGSMTVDNIEYVGKCKVTAGIKSAVISDEVGIAEFYQLSDGTVVYENAWTKKMTTKDGGLTWTAPEKASGIDNTGILNLQDGRLFRLEHKDTSNIVAWTSSDDGKTWTRMGDLNGCRPAARRVVLNASVTQASTGRIFVACDETFTEANSITGLYYSDDFGKTWFEAESAMGIPTSMGISTETTGFNFQEGTMTELPDGTIRYTARTGQGFVYYMDSKDGGKNYGEFRPTQFINPLCTYAFERDNKDPNTYYAIIEYDSTNYCYRYIHSPRNRFALMVSYDGCKTWEFAMTLNEWADYPLFDACNHAIKVYDDTIYINWNNLDKPRRSFVYAIDKSKLRTTKRFEEVHERTFRGAMSGETAEKQVILPKTSGNAYIFDTDTNVTVNGGKYDAATVAKAFGMKNSTSGSTTIFTLGGASVVFTEGSNIVTVNGTAMTFDSVCMQNGYIDIKACAKAFGKEITESDDVYVLWYGAPLAEQYLDDIVSYL